MTLESFFAEYLIVEWWGQKKPWALLLRPRTTRQRNTVATVADGTLSGHGTCALLGPTGCRLGADVRPHECATARSCNPQYDYNPRLIIAKAWRAAGQGPILRRLARAGRKAATTHPHGFRTALVKVDSDGNFIVVG